MPLLVPVLQTDSSDDAWGQNCDAIVIVAGANQEDVVSFPKVSQPAFTLLTLFVLVGTPGCVILGSFVSRRRR